jgi:nicotinate dehydrogenase subunit B
MADNPVHTTAAGCPAGDAPGRRDFLKTLGAGIFVLFSTDAPAVMGQETRTRGYPADLNAYLKIGEDGRVTVYSGKIEMGQGIVTSLAQMAADELGVSLRSVDMVLGDTQLCPFDMGTYGSMSTRFFGPALRAAAAEARAVLVELASEKLSVARTGLKVADGVVVSGSDAGKKASFAELAKGQKITRKLDTKPALRSVREFSIMGKPVKRTDAVAKVTGRAQYAGDIRRPGMLYCRVLHPPVHGARLKGVDTSVAEKMPGVIVVSQDAIVAVLHTEPDGAAKAFEALKPEFEVPAAGVDNRNIFDYLVEKAPEPRESERKGDVTAARGSAGALVSHTYVDGYGAHASIETHTALADVGGGKATLWVSTQTPFPCQQEVARALGFPPENVRVITPFVGGGFGGKSGNSRQAVEAATLSRITGRPVQVAWTRAEEFFFDYFRPAAVVKIASAVDGAGRISLWDYQVYFAGSRSAEQFYDVPNNLMRTYGQWSGDSVRTHPFGVGPWRAPGANINVFARESQIDIMAAAAKVDPLEFRLNNTSDKRMRSVLQSVAARFGYSKAPAPSRRGVGIACGIDAGTYVAEIAEIEVDRQSGKIKVKRIVCAQEMGTVINPEGATLQMEGCIMMGLGYTLSEDVRFKGGDVLDRNFDTYEIPRFSWLPEIETVLVPNDELTPQGGGEPAIVPIGAAVANAIFDATGARLFQMPFNPERVKTALTHA